MKKFVKGSDSDDEPRKQQMNSLKAKPSEKRGGNQNQGNVEEKDEHEKLDKGLMGSSDRGFSRGGSSSLSRKRHVRSIMSIKDFKLTLLYQNILPWRLTSKILRPGVRLHSDDPMVISITISGFKVARVLVDGGSSTNVIYWRCFEELQLPTEMFNHYMGTLVDFSDEQVEVHGYLNFKPLLGGGVCQNCSP